MDMDNQTFISDRKRELLRLFLSNSNIQFNSIVAGILPISYSCNKDLEIRMGLFSSKLQAPGAKTRDLFKSKMEEIQPAPYFMVKSRRPFGQLQTEHTIGIIMILQILLNQLTSWVTAFFGFHLSTT
jgi:hypothetical protein